MLNPQSAISNPQSIGLFGGAFNPVHLGHLILAERAREAMSLDVVLFVPANIPPHKRTGRLASAAHRVEMVKLATASNPNFRVEDMEIDREGISYTVDTLTALHEMYPRALLTLLLGADNARDFHSWHRPEHIARLASHGVWARPGLELPDELIPGVPLHRIDSPLIQISSTDIRQRIVDNRSIRYLTPEPVVEYIYEHGLYR